jgi:hypothetical protein
MTLLLHASTKTIRLTAMATLLTALCLGKKFLLRVMLKFLSLHTLLESYKIVADSTYTSNME